MEENLALGDNIGRSSSSGGRKLQVLDTSQPPFWLGSRERSTDRAHKGGQREPEDATCNMLHSCFLEPKKAKLSPVIDYARREQLARVETEGSDQG